MLDKSMMTLASALMIWQASVAPAQETARMRTIEGNPAYVAEKIKGGKLEKVTRL